MLAEPPGGDTHPEIAAARAARGGRAHRCGPDVVDVEPPLYEPRLGAHAGTAAVGSPEWSGPDRARERHRLAAVEAEPLRPLDAERERGGRVGVRYA